MVTTPPYPILDISIITMWNKCVDSKRKHINYNMDCLTCRLSRSQRTISLSFTCQSNKFSQTNDFIRNSNRKLVWILQNYKIPLDTLFSTTSLRAWSVARAPLMSLFFTIWTRSTPGDVIELEAWSSFPPILWSLTNPLSSLGKSSDCAERTSNRRSTW